MPLSTAATCARITAELNRPGQPFSYTCEGDRVVGTWDVANRRLVKRNAGCTEWEEFSGRSVAHGFWGGAGNFDEITFPAKDFDGATVRVIADRARDGAVIDFIDPSFWPAFNLADASIVVGVLALLYVAER